MNINVLQQTIKKGFKPYGEGKFHQQNLVYASACIKLGDYYYKNLNYRTALKYYKLLADLEGHHADGDFYEEDIELISLHKVALEKVGRMIIKGQGMRPDTLKAFGFLDRQPNEFAPSKRREFSELIFGHTQPFLKSKTQGDSLLQLAINPFLIYDSTTIAEVDKELMRFDFQMEKDTSKTCNIYFVNSGSHSFFNEYGAGLFGYFLGNLLTPTISKYASHYSLDLYIDDSSQYTISSIHWPVLNIHLTKVK